MRGPICSISELFLSVLWGHCGVFWTCIKDQSLRKRRNYSYHSSCTRNIDLSTHFQKRELVKQAVWPFLSTNQASLTPGVNEYIFVNLFIFRPTTTAPIFGGQLCAPSSLLSRELLPWRVLIIGAEVAHTVPFASWNQGYTPSLHFRQVFAPSVRQLLKSTATVLKFGLLILPKTSLSIHVTGINCFFRATFSRQVLAVLHHQSRKYVN